MEAEQADKCPKCNSDRIRILNMNYPKSYECEDCKYVFVKSKQALLDE